MLIGLVGKKQSGKSSVAGHLTNRYDFIEVSWADPLKEVIGKQLLGLTHEQLYGNSALKERIVKQWGKSPRQMLQLIGTDLFRSQFDIDIWVKLGLENIKKYMKADFSIVISDCRFLNEVEAIKSLGGKTIRLTREDHETDDLHLSETELDDYKTDFTIACETGLEDLHKHVDQIMKGLHRK